MMKRKKLTKVLNNTHDEEKKEKTENTRTNHTFITKTHNELKAKEKKYVLREDLKTVKD